MYYSSGELLDDSQSTPSEASTVCNAGCCEKLDTPNQPIDRALLDLTKQQIGNKSEYRSLNPQWYKEFPWIHLCKDRKKVFCYHCLSAYDKGLLQPTRRFETAFFVEGFQNWKKAVERFRRHEIAECHKEAVLKLKGLRGPTVIEQLSSEAAKTRAENRTMHLKVLSSLRFLLRQGLAIRGHKESEGNLIRLLHLRSDDSPQLAKWINNQQYLSPEIINELITLIGNDLLRQLLSSIHGATWYAILADETADVANHEQLSVSIRWVDDAYEINEDFIGLVHVPRTTAITLTIAIKDVLIRCALPLTQCRGQSYDGASNMMGHLHGVATQIQTEETTAISVHCLAHSLNLCLQDAAKKCVPVRNALDIVMEISKLIRYSPKRTLVFEQCKQDMSIPGTSLRPLCPTRWTVRTAAIDAVLRNYPALLETLETISSESHDDYGRRANGILAQLERFDTYFGLKLSHLVFSETEQTSIALQGKSTTVQEALMGAGMAKSYLVRQRDDEAFDSFYASMVDQAKEYTDDPVLPRYRRIPKRLDDGAQPHRFTAAQDYYRAQYYEVLDLLGGEISRRFDQDSLALPIATEELLTKAANNVEGSDISLPAKIIEAYSRDIDMKELGRQLQMFPDLVSAYKSSQHLKLSKITTIHIICDMLQEVPMAREIFCEVDKLLRIYLTIPVTTATAERSFSALRRVKTYLCSTMSEQRLNNVMLCHVHKDLYDDLDLLKVAKIFVSASSRRQGFFGNF